MGEIGAHEALFLLGHIAHLVEVDSKVVDRIGDQRDPPVEQGQGLGSQIQDQVLVMHVAIAEHKGPFTQRAHRRFHNGAGAGQRPRRDGVQARELHRELGSDSVGQGRAVGVHIVDDAAGDKAVDGNKTIRRRV